MPTYLRVHAQRLERLAVATTVLGLSLGSIGLTPTTSQAAPAAGPGAIALTSTPGPITAGTVPDGTCRAAMSLLGGNGGSSTAGTGTGGVGGSGARIGATINVLPLQSYSGAVGGGGSGTAGGIGYAAGGAGGTGTGHRGFSGGGATGFKIAGLPMLIAGGGGGGSAAHQNTPAGLGGHAGFAVTPGAAAAGADGNPGVDTPTAPGGGQGGQVGAGGAGGTNPGTPSTNGSAGNGVGVGTGGIGGPDPSLDTSGGGGGGYTGGGGGASTATTNATGGGGGGGSSWLVATSPTASAEAPKNITTSKGPAQAAGSVTGTAGSLAVDWLPCVYDLAVSKSVSAPHVYQGGTVVWTVTVTNNGPDYMTRGDTVDLADTLPAGPNAGSPSFKVLSFDVAGGSNADLTRGPITCTGLALGASMPASTTCSRPYQSVTGTPGSPTSGTRGLDVGEKITIMYEQQLSSAATCPSSLKNTATISDRATTSGTTDIVGVIASGSASASVSVLCGAKLKLVKAFGGPRSESNHQYTMSISGGAAPAGSSATTTGSGSTVDPNTGVVAVGSALPGQAYVFDETGPSLGAYEKSVSCTGGSAGTAVPSGVVSLPFSITPSGGDDIVCTLTNTPYPYSMVFKKSVDASGPLTLGSSLPYTFNVENNGTIDFNSFTITDPKVTGLTCDRTDLPVAKTAVCTAVHVITQADVDAGRVENTAAIAGTAAGLPPYSDSSNKVVTPIPQDPKISVKKSSTTTDYAAVGDPINYEFVVTNDGNTTLTLVNVTDPKVNGVTCGSAVLTPGDSTTCTGTRSATQDDLNAGKVVNTATVSGTTPGGATVTNTSNTVEVNATQRPSLSIAKSVVGTSYDTIGQIVKYNFTITNDGNVTLDNVGVKDANATGLVCTPMVLQPGEQAACTGEHTVTQMDIDAGALINTATATADAPNGKPVTAPSNTVTIGAAQDPQLEVKKSASLTSITTVGETISYTIEVTNKGNTTLHDVTVTDPIAAPITCPTGPLEPTKSVVCTGTHIVTLSDLNAGTVINVAAASALLPDGSMTPSTNSNQVTVPAIQKPSLTVQKSSDKTSIAVLGESITYTFVVTNTGNVTVSGIAINDPKTSTVTCDSSALDPGKTATCTGTHVVTQNDLDSGKLDNTAQVTGTDPQGLPISPAGSNTVSVPADQQPTMTVTKSSTAANYTAPGDVVQYTFTVTNTGNVTLNALALTDPVVPNVTCPKTTLAPSEFMECSASLIITQAELDKGRVVNTATLQANTPSGAPAPTVTSNTVTVPAIQKATVSIAKASAVTSVDTIGQTVPFTFVVTNTGNITMTALQLSDPMIPSITCDVSTLLPGEKATCTGNYTVTAADLDAGRITNTASISGKTPSGGDLPSQSSNTVTIPAIQKPHLTIAKVATAQSFSTVGESIQFNFTVTNDGNVTVSNVQVNDPKLTSVTCLASTLPAGAVTSCSGEHVVTQADLDSGSLVNTATVTGTPPSGATLAPEPSNTITLPAVQAPDLQIVKASSTSTFTNVGDKISYTFTVTNRGNVTVHDLTVSDPTVGAVTCPTSTLAPTEVVVCSATYAVTQTDLDNTKRLNTASVEARGPSNNVVGPTPSNTVEVPAVPNPKLAITKSVANAAPTKAGEKVLFNFVVTNTGNQTLTHVVVSDANATNISCAASTLAPTASTTCTAEHVATQADVDAGFVVNVAEVSGTPQVGPATPPSPSNEVTVPITASPAISIIKKTVATTYQSVGETIMYTFDVTNDGNVTLLNVAVSDPLVSGIQCSKQRLVPNESTKCTGTRSVTQSDLDGASIINTASVNASSPGGTPVTADSNAVTIPATQKPAMTITKATLTQSVAIAGLRIPYTFEVQNTGNVTLNSLTIADANAEQIACPFTQLAPAQSMQCSAIHVVTQTDVDSGAVINQASISAKGPQGESLAPVDSNPVTVPMIRKPALSITKSTDTTSYRSLGEVVPYTFTVTNTGNVTMSDVAVTDPTTTAVVCDNTKLAPAASTTCRASHTVTQADLDAGKLINTASVRGVGPDGVTIAPVDSNTIEIPAVQSPKLQILKSSGTKSVRNVGDSISYAFIVSNVGNVTIHDVAITDPKVFGVTCDRSTLAPTDSASCTASHLVTQADLDATEVVNTANVQGTGPDGAATPTATSNTITVPAEQLPKLAINKSVDLANYSTLGDSALYTFAVRNEGNVTTRVQVTDPNVTAVTCPTLTLAPGESTTCTARRSISQIDLDAGAIINTAKVSGTTAGGEPVAPVASNTVTIPATQQPKLSVRKRADKSSLSKAGEVVRFDFVVSNDGNVTISNVVLTDPMIADLLCADSLLAPATTTTCTGTHKLTQTEVDEGELVNQASVVGTTPGGAKTKPTLSNEVRIPVPSEPALTIKKAAGLAAFFKVGQQIDYTFNVANNGNVTMHGVAVTDPLVPSLSCPKTELAPGEDMVCSASHLITQKDLDRGVVTNTASVSGTDPAGTALPKVNSNTVKVPATQTPQLSITKKASQSTYGNVGDAIDFTFVVTNEGNVTLAQLSVSDPLTGDVRCDKASLEPKQSTSCTATRRVTQSDLDAGHIVNTASANAQTPDGRTATAKSNTVTVLGQSTTTIPIVAVLPDLPKPIESTSTLVSVTPTSPASVAPSSTTANSATTAVTSTTAVPSTLGSAPDTKKPVSNDSGEVTSQTFVGASVFGNDSVRAPKLVNFTQPPNGTVSMNPDGTFVYTPKRGFVGYDKFTYTLVDADGNESTATVTMHVKGIVLDAPTDLAFTGRNALGFLFTGSLLVLVGAALVLVTRRRRLRNEFD